MKKRIHLWDVDGCMVLHQFPGGKQNADITKDKPFKWVLREALKADVNIMVSGRGSELKDVTLAWWDENSRDVYGIPPCEMSYVGVDWKHQETHDQGLDDYIQRKVKKLLQIISDWGAALIISEIVFEVHVYEDDVKVLEGVRNKLTIVGEKKGRVFLHVVKDGELHDYK